MAELLRLDTDLLIWINSWHNAFFDHFFWQVTQRLIWVPLYVVMAACLVRQYGKQSIWFLVAAALCVGLSDFVSSGIIKHLVCRPRPTRVAELEGILHIVNNYRGGRYGFVSSHAANTFSLALFFSLIRRDWRTIVPLMLWVVLNCWSRMYLGVHYPLDILGGLVVGGAMAGMVYGILTLCVHLLEKRKAEKQSVPYISMPLYKKGDPLLSPLWNWAICLTFVLTCVAAVIF